MQVPVEQGVFCILTPPPPRGKVASFSGAAFSHMTLDCMVFLLKHMWPQDFFLLCFSRVRWQHKTSLVEKLILRTWTFVFIITAHTLQGMSPKGAFFFFFSFNMVPGELAQSHTLKSLYKRRGKIRYFDSLGTVSCQLKTFTIQRSTKQLNISIQLTHTHTRPCTHTRTVTQGSTRLFLWLLSREQNLNFEVSYSSI